MKSYLCKCNNCDSIFYDENPKSETPLIETDNVGLDIFRMELFTEEGQSFYGCSHCETDAFLVDIDDLFNFPEFLPSEIKAILDKYAADDNDYTNCEMLLSEMEAEGYTFDYGLCGTPLNLRIIENQS